MSIFIRSTNPSETSFALLRKERLYGGASLPNIYTKYGSENDIFMSNKNGIVYRRNFRDFFDLNSSVVR